MRRNACIDFDAYKAVHPLAVNQGLTELSNYGGGRNNGKYPINCVFGFDPIIQESFMSVPTNADIEEAREELISTFGYDVFRMKAKDTGLSSEEVWKKVQKLGYRPLEIKAVPEGSLVQKGNAIFTTKSTEPWFAKHTQGSETLLSHLWYPTLISTRFKFIKERLRPLVELTGTIALLDFMINDFGARGGAGFEASVLGGMAVLLHGQGSDNMSASRLIKDYYGFQGRAKSLWGTEHSTSLSFGLGEGEYNYVIAQLDGCPLDRMVAMVIDTYDSRNFMQVVIARPDILAKIKARAEAGGRTIFRPDSGIPEEQIDMVFDALTAHFGYRTNEKGYKVFNHSVGAIQGDGMNEHTIIALYEYIIKNHWSTDNLAVGSGGGLLQVDANRDVISFAIKPSFGVIDGVDTYFEKNPKTDPSKKSLSGNLKLHLHNGGMYRTYSDNPSSFTDQANFNSLADSLKVVLRNGVYLSENKFDEMIQRASRTFSVDELKTAI